MWLVTAISNTCFPLKEGGTLVVVVVIRPYTSAKKEREKDEVGTSKQTQKKKVNH